MLLVWQQLQFNLSSLAAPDSAHISWINFGLIRVYLCSEDVVKMKDIDGEQGSSDGNFDFR